MLRDRAQAVVARESATEPQLQPARLEIDLVVDGDERLGLHLVEAGGRADGAARLVHERLRLEQRQAQPVHPNLRDLARELRPEGAAVPPCQLVGDEEADVVPRARVLAPWIAEAGDEEVERRGVLAPTENAQLALGVLLLAGGVGLRLGGLIRRSLRAFLLRHFALDLLALLELLLDGLGLLDLRRGRDRGED